MRSPRPRPLRAWVDGIRNRSEAGDCRDQPLWSRRGSIGAGGGAYRGARPFPGQVPPGESITVDFGYVRSPLGALIEWGETYGTVFSTHLSDDGESFREMGRIATGNGGSDSFWWRSTTSRYLRLTVHEASSPGRGRQRTQAAHPEQGSHANRSAGASGSAGRGDLYPQSLLGRQVYWTVLGEFDRAEEALFDEYGNLEPRADSARSLPCFAWTAPCTERPRACPLANPSSMARCPFRPSRGPRRT